MAEGKPEQEPSIEEILASIREIISDDDEQAGEEEAQEAQAPAAEAAEPAEPPQAEEAPDEPAPAEDVLELTAEMQDEPEPIDSEEEEVDLDEDFDIALAEINETLAAGEPEIEETEKEMVSTADETPPDGKEAGPAAADEILSDEAKQAAVSSMAKLAAGMPISKPKETAHHYEGVTLEDIVRDLLNPMLREWMDTNLPPMVERLVQKELEKLARRAAE